ncbi:hypothetical protein [Methylobacterium terrae]|uniref:hypothetical protein n=1 Tax=Methylobacterium terrae TaxID=2202827 RepID=UPI0013A5A989|nr:hypothetical protein [Methylobacterium terrae]
MPDEFVLGQQPETVEAWCGVARRNQAASRTLLNRSHPLEAWSAAGFAVECALKAAVMSHLRFNRFPAREEPPDLYTHDLVHLARQAGIDFGALIRDPVAPSFQTVLLWKRTEGVQSEAHADEGRTGHGNGGDRAGWSNRVAGQTLPTGHLKAGAEYLSALRGLGLDPEGLLWAHDRTVQDFVLVLVTAQFDAVGPLELYRLLTHAYNAAATPQAVSPVRGTTAFAGSVGRPRTAQGLWVGHSRGSRPARPDGSYGDG